MKYKYTRKEIVDWKYIPLTQGYKTKVSIEDYDEVKKHSWHTLTTKTGFITAGTTDNNHRIILLSRFIMKPPKGMVVDHINHDTLDNRRENLRVCTHQENHFNTKLSKNSTGYKGVRAINQLIKGRKYTYYYAQIQHNEKRLHLGSFKNPEDAAKAYDKKALELFGEFALTNEMLGLIKPDKDQRLVYTCPVHGNYYKVCKKCPPSPLDEKFDSPLNELDNLLYKVKNLIIKELKRK